METEKKRAAVVAELDAVSRQRAGLQEQVWFRPRGSKRQWSFQLYKFTLSLFLCQSPP